MQYQQELMVFLSNQLSTGFPHEAVRQRRVNNSEAMKISEDSSH
jgi:hypothetical protein